MKALKAYIEHENRWRGLFSKADLLAMPTNAAECEPVFEDIECKLSPENLHCDGEASPAQVRRELKRLKGAWADLEKIRGSKRAEYEGYAY